MGTIRALNDTEFEAWLPLWKGYQAFYGVTIDHDVSAETWRRFFDPTEPMHVLGAFDGDNLLGIVHFIYHRSTWTTGHYCYLQDLFTVEAARGKGIGRALIEAVYERAHDEGASRVYWLTQEGNTDARHLYDKVADMPGFIQYRKLF